MANNRLWIKDKKTGDKIMLAKYYPSGGWYCKVTIEEIDKFFESHHPQSGFGNEITVEPEVKE